MTRTVDGLAPLRVPGDAAGMPLSSLDNLSPRLYVEQYLEKENSLFFSLHTFGMRLIMYRAQGHFRKGVTHEAE
jgi:hypothetical protein